jgi:hypothetical protein
MNLRTSLLAAAAIAATALMAPRAQAQNLVTNPGFETGDTTGYFTYTSTGFGVDNGVYTSFDGELPYAGNYFLVIGNYVPSIATFAQTLATTPGQNYTFSLEWENNGDNGPAGSTNQLFEVQWDGQTLYSVDGGYNTQGYNLLSFDVVGTGSDTFAVSGYSLNSVNAVDNISVTPSSLISAAPEPSTWLLMIAGVAGIGLMLRRANTSVGLRGAVVPA